MHGWVGPFIVRLWCRVCVFAFATMSLPFSTVAKFFQVGLEMDLCIQTALLFLTMGDLTEWFVLDFDFLEI